MHAVHDRDPDAYSAAVGELALPEDSTHLRPSPKPKPPHYEGTQAIQRGLGFPSSGQPG